MLEELLEYLERCGYSEDIADDIHSEYCGVGGMARVVKYAESMGDEDHCYVQEVIDDVVKWRMSVEETGPPLGYTLLYNVPNNRVVQDELSGKKYRVETTIDCATPVSDHTPIDGPIVEIEPQTDWLPLPGTEIAVGHLVIVNEDRPETGLIAVILDHIGNTCTVKYLNRKLKRMSDGIGGGFLEKASLITPIADFGVEVITDGKHYKAAQFHFKTELEWQDSEQIVRGRKKLLKLSLDRYQT